MCYRGNHSTLGTSVKCGMSLTHQLCKPMAYTVSSRTFQHLTHTYTTDAVTTAPAADAAWPENPGSASLKRRMKRTQAALVRVPPQRADSLGGSLFFPPLSGSVMVVSAPNPGADYLPTRSLEHAELCEPRSSNWEFEMEMMADFFPHPGNLSPSSSSNSF